MTDFFKHFKCRKCGHIIWGFQRLGHMRRDHKDQGFKNFRQEWSRLTALYLPVEKVFGTYHVMVTDK